MRRITGIIAAAATALLLTACGSSSDDDSTAAPAAKNTTLPAEVSAVPPSELTAEQKASIAEGVGYPPSADAATQAAYVAALDKIDKDIAHGKADKAVSRGRDTCRTIKENPGDRAKIVDATQKRFTSPDAPEGRTAAVAEKIVEAAHTHLCPSFTLPKG